eukprot:3643651-Pyramimonas_sp.AAC.1
MALTCGPRPNQTFLDHAAWEHRLLKVGGAARKCLPASNVSLSLRVTRQKAMTILGVRPQKIRESLRLLS